MVKHIVAGARFATAWLDPKSTTRIRLTRQREVATVGRASFIGGRDQEIAPTEDAQ